MKASHVTAKCVAKEGQGKCKAMQSKANAKARQSKAMQSNAKHCKARQCAAMQSKGKGKANMAYMYEDYSCGDEWPDEEEHDNFNIEATYMTWDEIKKMKDEEYNIDTSGEDEE